MFILTFLLLLVAAFYDVKYRRIPNIVVLLLLLTGIFSVCYYNNLTQKLSGLVFPAILLIIPYLFNKTGAGDIKLIAAIGLITGVMINTTILLLSFVLVLIFNVFLLIIRKKPTSSVPFAAFVCASFSLVMLFSYIF